jgi:CrcB protein
MQAILYVFIGGGIGSVLRYLIGLKLNQANMPYGTLLTNILGSLFIGLVMSYHLKSTNHNLSTNQMALLVIGVFGGFTTFSSFMYENLQLLIHQQYYKFFAYALGSILIGFIAVSIGFYIGKQFA